MVCVSVLIQPVNAGVLRDAQYLFLQRFARFVLLCERFGVLLQLFLARGGLGLGALQVHQVERDILPLAAFHAVEVNPILLHLSIRGRFDSSPSFR